MYEWRFLNYKEREVKREGRSVSQSDGYDKRFVAWRRMLFWWLDHPSRVGWVGESVINQ